MKCKYCGKRMKNGQSVCACCGQAPSEDPQQNAAEESWKRARRMTLLSGMVAAMAVLATVLFFLMRSGWQLTGCSTAEKVPLTKRGSYSVSDKKAYRNRNVQVASMGSDTLTNGQLQIYYWTQVYDFVSNYSYSLTAVGLDLSKPLDEQVMEADNNTLRYLLGYVDGNMTWQQYFLQGAIQMWQSNQALAQMARQAGYEMDEESRKKLEELPQELEKDAKAAGFDSVEAYLQDSMGPGCTQEDYLAYMQTYYLGYSYFAHLYDQIETTPEQLESFYLENESEFIAYGITPNMGYTVDVRHILITPGGQINLEGQKYTDAQWEACRASAQQILDQWLAGEQTEERFAQLAKQYSQDSQDNVDAGGLYTYIQKGELEEGFDNWCFDEQRQPGHYGLIKTSYGYHVMYFVGVKDLWMTQVRAVYLNQESQKIVSAILDSHPIQVDYSKIVLGKVELP